MYRRMILAKMQELLHSERNLLKSQLALAEVETIRHTPALVAAVEAMIQRQNPYLLMQLVVIGMSRLPSLMKRLAQRWDHSLSCRLVISSVRRTPTRPTSTSNNIYAR